MNASLDAKAVARNAVRDSLQDGLIELSLGVYFLLIGLVIQAKLLILFFLLVVVAQPLLKQLKERYTYPRIGYVKFKKENRNAGRNMLIALLAAVIATGLVLLLRRNDYWAHTLYQWAPLITTFILMIVLAVTGRRSGLMRYYVMAVLALLVGLVIPFVDLPDKMDRIALYLFVMGAIFLPWGAVLFTRFLQNNPVRVEELQ
jgi:hypothetical protein